MQARRLNWYEKILVKMVEHYSQGVPHPLLNKLVKIPLTESTKKLFIDFLIEIRKEKLIIGEIIYLLDQFLRRLEQFNEEADNPQNQNGPNKQEGPEDYEEKPEYYLSKILLPSLVIAMKMIDDQAIYIDEYYKYAPYIDADDNIFLPLAKELEITHLIKLRWEVQFSTVYETTHQRSIQSRINNIFQYVDSQDIPEITMLLNDHEIEYPQQSNLWLYIISVLNKKIETNTHSNKKAADDIFLRPMKFTRHSISLFGLDRTQFKHYELVRHINLFHSTDNQKTLLKEIRTSIKAKDHILFEIFCQLIPYFASQKEVNHYILFIYHEPVLTHKYLSTAIGNLLVQKNDENESIFHQLILKSSPLLPPLLEYALDTQSKLLFTSIANALLIIPHDNIPTIQRITALHECFVSLLMISNHNEDIRDEIKKFPLCVNLSGKNLMDVDFSNMDLSNIDLTSTDLRFANLKNASGLNAQTLSTCQLIGIELDFITASKNAFSDADIRLINDTINTQCVRVISSLSQCMLLKLDDSFYQIINLIKTIIQSPSHILKYPFPSTRNYFVELMLTSRQSLILFLNNHPSISMPDVIKNDIEFIATCFLPRAARTMSAKITGEHLLKLIQNHSLPTLRRVM